MNKEQLNYKLCFVRDGAAYFSSDLDLQWGDDWNDAPYEHNAGEPYGLYQDDARTKVVKIYWEGPFCEPCEGQLNSSFSVEMINSGKCPWLQIYGFNYSIPAGTSLKDFIEIMKQHDGRIWVPLEDAA